MAGLGKYFNSETYRGRANVAKATYASLALIYSYFRMKRADPVEEKLSTVEVRASTHTTICEQTPPPPTPTPVPSSASLSASASSLAPPACSVETAVQQEELPRGDLNKDQALEANPAPFKFYDATNENKAETVKSNVNILCEPK